MPRLTTQQLQEAKRKKQAEEHEAFLREAGERRRKAQETAEQRDRDRVRRDTYNLLTSTAGSLYTEMDKLARKAPKEAVTDLNLRMMNATIQDVKQLIPDDAQLQRITSFEAAGDNPEYRDAVLVMAQVRAALDRFISRNRQAFSEVDKPVQQSPLDQAVEALPDPFSLR